MKLYELRPVEELSEDDHPWRPWYDKAFGLLSVQKHQKEPDKSHMKALVMRTVGSLVEDKRQIQKLLGWMKNTQHAKKSMDPVRRA